jgi:hypothetical protein
MDENTRFIIERIDRVADDIVNRFVAALAEHKTEDSAAHREFNERLDKLETAYAKVLGGAFVVGALASILIKRLGG